MSAKRNVQFATPEKNLALNFKPTGVCPNRRCNYGLGRRPVRKFILSPRSVCSRHDPATEEFVNAFVNIARYQFRLPLGARVTWPSHSSHFSPPRSLQSHWRMRPSPITQATNPHRKPKSTARIATAMPTPRTVPRPAPNTAHTVKTANIKKASASTTKASTAVTAPTVSTVGTLNTARTVHMRGTARRQA